MKLSNLQRITLYIFFFSLNFEVWELFHTAYFSLSKLTGLIYFFTLIPELFYFLKVNRIKRFLIPLFSFFVLLTIINCLNINSLSYSFFNFSIFQNIILVIILVNHAKKEPGILEKGMMFYAFGSVLFSLLFLLGIGVDSRGGRISMFGDNENVIGIRMCISVIYLAYLTIQNPFKFGRKKFLFLLPIPMMMSLLLATGSRLGFLSFALCFLAGLILLKTNKSYTKVIILGVGILISIYFWNHFLSSSLVYERLLKTAETDDLSGRGDIWSSLVPLIEKNSLFGVGTTGYDVYSQEVFGRYLSPHNVILEILCYTGIIGLLMYLWFFIRIVQVSLRKYRISGSVIQLVLLIPIIGNLFVGHILLTKIGWVLFAFCIGKTYYEGLISKKRFYAINKKVGFNASY